MTVQSNKPTSSEVLVPNTILQYKEPFLRTSPAVYWLRFGASTAGGMGSIPGELRSQVPCWVPPLKKVQDKDVSGVGSFCSGGRACFCFSLVSGGCQQSCYLHLQTLPSSPRLRCLLASPFLRVRTSLSLPLPPSPISYKDSSLIQFNLD